MINVCSCVRKSVLVYVLIIQKLYNKSNNSHILVLKFAVNRKVMNRLSMITVIPQKQCSDVLHCRVWFIVMIEVCSVQFSRFGSIHNSILTWWIFKQPFQGIPFICLLEWSQFTLLHWNWTEIKLTKKYSHRGSDFGWTFPCDLAPTLLLWWLTFINKYNILIPFGGVHKEGKGSKQKDL